jgi:hypothetical protein
MLLTTHPIPPISLLTISSSAPHSLLSHFSGGCGSSWLLLKAKHYDTSFFCFFSKPLKLVGEKCYVKDEGVSVFDFCFWHLCVLRFCVPCYCMQKPVLFPQNPFYSTPSTLYSLPLFKSLNYIMYCERKQAPVRISLCPFIYEKRGVS